jgi:hypothetical protein
MVIYLYDSFKDNINQIAVRERHQKTTKNEAGLQLNS